MSQQEFYQEPQSQENGQQPLQDNEINVIPQPYYWSTRPPTLGVPKDEPVLHDDYAADYQHGYSAQTPETPTSYQAGAFKADGPQTPNQFQASQSQRRRFSPDGDSFESQYRPYASRSAQWSVPVWARPQRNHPARWFWLALLAVIFMGPLLHVLAVVGVIFLTLLLPFLVVAIFALPYLFFRAVTGRPYRHWRNNNYWRGPWSW